MNLRSCNAYWLLKNGILNSYPSLQKEDKLESEIVVIGAGITGALISHSLVEAGYKVILIDKNDIAMGSTSATTSLLQYEIDVPLVELSDMIGESQAAECYEAGRTAIDKLKNLVNDYNIDCCFELKQSLYVSHNRKSSKFLYEEFLLRDKYNLGVVWKDSKSVKNNYGINSYGGILSDKAACVDAYKLANNLIEINNNRGMKVFDSTPIKSIDYEYKKSNVLIKCESGAEIICNKVIFCTGFETVNMFKEKIADLFSTFACISEQNINISDTIKDLLIWDTQDPYIYMRLTEDNRLLVGGGDTNKNLPTIREKIKDLKTKDIIKKVYKILPKTDFIQDFRWAGTFGATKDGLPYIGKHDRYPNSYFVLGFGGNGITFSIQGMELILKLLMGEQDNLLNYYRFHR